MEERIARALAALTTGIYVLTTRDESIRHGMSSSWVTQVSGAPPLIAVAVDRRHLSQDLVRRTRHFALNVVGRDDRSLEDYFYSAASRTPSNLDRVPHGLHSSGLPVLRGALGALICEVEAQHPAGDHTLFVARLADTAGFEATALPLTSQDLDYVYVGTVVKR